METLMESYNLFFQNVVEHPLCTPYQKAAWIFSLELENEGFISSEKGENIRNNLLTVAYDPNQRRIIDLLNPDNPREEVIRANWRIKSFAWRNLAKIRGQVHKTYTELPPEILSQPGMKSMLTHFPDIDLGETTVYIYGKRKGKASYYLVNDQEEIGIKAICVSKDLYGLPTHLIELVTKVYCLGIYPNRVVGSELIHGCFELIAREGHPSYVGVADFVDWLVSPLGYNAPELAKQFILGNPEPLFDALRQANPLAPALLTFISDEAEDTETGICRLTVMEALKLVGTTK